MLEEGPVYADLVVPLDNLPENLQERMGAEWRLRKENRKVREGKRRIKLLDVCVTLISGRG